MNCNNCARSIPKGCGIQYERYDTEKYPDGDTGDDFDFFLLCEWCDNALMDGDIEWGVVSRTKT